MLQVINSIASIPYVTNNLTGSPSNSCKNGIINKVLKAKALWFAQKCTCITEATSSASRPPVLAILLEWKQGVACFHSRRSAKRGTLGFQRMRIQSNEDSLWRRGSGALSGGGTGKGPILDVWLPCLLAFPRIPYTKGIFFVVLKRCQLGEGRRMYSSTSHGWNAISDFSCFPCCNSVCKFMVSMSYPWVHTGTWQSKFRSAMPEKIQVDNCITRYC